MEPGTSRTMVDISALNVGTQPCHSHPGVLCARGRCWKLPAFPLKSIWALITGSPRSTLVWIWREGGCEVLSWSHPHPKIKFSMKSSSSFPLLFPSPQLTSHLSLAVSSFLGKTCFSFLLKAKTSCRRREEKVGADPPWKSLFPWHHMGLFPPGQGPPSPPQQPVVWIFLPCLGELPAAPQPQLFVSLWSGSQ